MTIKRFLIVALVLMLAATAWAGKSGKKGGGDLEQQIADLQKALEQQQAAYEAALAEQFAELSKKIDARFAGLEQKIAEAIRSPEEKEREAQQLLAEVNRLANTAEYDQANAKMAELQRKYGTTDTAKRARRLQQELAVFGKATPADLGIEKWYQGSVDHQNGNTTLLVFWETWCPHCQREVPKLQQMYDKYKGRGLQVVGLTKLTRSATDEAVETFIDEKNVGYPMAKENGNASSYFNVSGIPAAAVVKDGKVVWRGHPARLTDQMIEDWM
jgi:thiol-disulfide isomerase/thioredoxin